MKFGRFFFAIESLSLYWTLMFDDSEHDAEIETISLPLIQKIFLLIMLIFYPAASLLMGLTGRNDPSEITSKIEQVYIPTLLIQALLLGALWFTLFRSRARFAEIGFAREDISWSNAGSAVIFFIGAWVLMVIIKGSMERSGYLAETDYFTLLPSSLLEGALWLCLSVGAAFSEELIFRGFVITRLQKLTGRFWIGAVIGSAAFSLGHLYQGYGGVILTFLYGLLFAALFAARKSVFPCVVAHFLQDAVVLAALILAK